VFISALKGSKMNRSAKKKYMIFELFILFLAALALGFIYLAYALIQVYQLRKNILLKTKYLNLELRHITDLYVFTSDQSAIQGTRYSFLSTQELSKRVSLFKEINKSLSSNIHSSYSSKYVQSLSLAHEFNNNLLKLNQLKKSLLYKIISKIIASDVASLRAVSIA
jgi:predicted RNA-binding protein with EMAP domain